MSYEITKKDGATKTVNTASQLFSELDDINKGWTSGEGSTISRNGAELFHSSHFLNFQSRAQDDYDQQVNEGIPANHRQPKEKPSIKKLVAFKAYYEEYGHYAI